MVAASAGFIWSGGSFALIFAGIKMRWNTRYFWINQVNGTLSFKKNAFINDVLIGDFLDIVQ